MTYNSDWERDHDDAADTAALEFVSQVDDWRSTQMLWVAETIRRYEIAVITVGSGACSDPDCPTAHLVEAVPWSYSIGFAERELPELVTFGLPADRATRLFNAVRDRVRAGRPVAAGDHLVLLGTQVRFDAVPVGWIRDRDIDPMGTWFAHYGVGRPRIRPPAVLQLVWPDTRGHFPDSSTCSTLVQLGQPVGARLLGNWANPPGAERLRDRWRRLA